jgi:predicted SprT family Zn-dependent metalloprotease
MSTKPHSKRSIRRAILDLFSPQRISVPAPATLYTRMREEQARASLTKVSLDASLSKAKEKSASLPSIEELYQLFDRINWTYFAGKLPRVKIEYSSRMGCAGTYTPDEKLIQIGKKYHTLFPTEIEDTLKHEMIHIIHFYHDAKFKKEAERIGATLKAKSHPSLMRPPKYIYECPGCKSEFPRQKPFRMASCGPCSKGKYTPKFKLVLKKSR